MANNAVAGIQNHSLDHVQFWKSWYCFAAKMAADAVGGIQDH